VHHHLGFEQPERIGLGGLWSALDVPAPGGGGRSATEEPRHPVGRSTGAADPSVGEAVAALLRSQPSTPAADVAA
jgi:hypothetical protein